MDEELVWMKHPDLPENEPVQVTKSALEDSWQELGWQESDPPESATAASETVDYERYPNLIPAAAERAREKAEKLAEQTAEANKEADRLEALAAKTGADSGGTDAGKTTSEKASK